MKTDWFQTITNLSILFGIGLIVYEINQTATLTKTELVDNFYVQETSKKISLMGESPSDTLTRAIVCPERLDANDVVILNSYYTSLLLDALRALRGHGLGYFEETGDYAAITRSRAILFHTKPGRAWWRIARVGRGVPDEVVAVMDEALESLEMHDGFDKDIEQILEQSGANLRKAYATACPEV